MDTKVKPAYDPAQFNPDGTRKKFVEGDDEDSEQLNEMANRYLQQKGPLKKGGPSGNTNTKTGNLKLSNLQNNANNGTSPQPSVRHLSPAELLAQAQAPAPAPEEEAVEDDGWVSVQPKHHTPQGRRGRGRGKPRRFSSENRRPQFDQHQQEPRPQDA
ncbi:hypothetical protein TRICI_001346 [Trichomonascus ciferrii]|uniref:Uncharacterized protein n=1 Tax=Trichomonascus ciferrii TaxID=44093 RepID=A0A642V9M7_9ASCO|nr:hypothetical protein TRICI_001346 [Trichomonascus ciferrii]